MDQNKHLKIIADGFSEDIRKLRKENDNLEDKTDKLKIQLKSFQERNDNQFNQLIELTNKRKKLEEVNKQLTKNEECREIIMHAINKNAVKLQKEIDSKKTQAAKQKYEEIKEKGMKIIRADREGLYFAIATYITFQSAKRVLMNKLNSIQSIGSFLRTNSGFKVTNPEGYVAIKKSGAVKLVDRLEFSRANFTMAKNWVKG